MQPFRETLLFSGLITLAAATPAFATDTFGTDVDVFVPASSEFIAGDGIPKDNFSQDNAIEGVQSVSVALKARDRDTGQANSRVGNRYFVDPGFSANNPAFSNLAIDYQFDPGVDGITNFMLRLSIDFDPAVGVADFTTFQLPIFDADGIPDATLDSWIDSDGYFLTNQGNGTWNDQNVPYVISDSVRMDFSFFPPYDPNAIGEYELRLEALDPTGSIVLADITIFAVVPAPGALALLGVAGLTSTRRRRRG